MPRSRKIRSFDEFSSLQSTQRTLDWRDLNAASSADCTVVVNGVEKEYRLHLRALCKSSGFFFDVLIGTVKPIQVMLKDSIHTGVAGVTHIKMQDGSTVSMGEESDTMRDLKNRVNDQHGIPVEYQQYFEMKGSEQVNITEDWKLLSEYANTLLLIPLEPWQRVDNEKKAVHLSLPKPCVEVFERVLDFMYHYRCSSDICLRKLGELSPSSALGALWLAGHLDIPDLQDHIMDHLSRMVTPSTAHAYLSTAVSLGQGKIVATLTQLASRSLSSLPTEACNSLPLEVVEGLLAGSSVSETGWRLVVSCLKAREAEGKLDEVIFRRLMQSFTSCQQMHSISGCQRSVEESPSETFSGEEASSGDSDDENLADEEMLETDICFARSTWAENAAALLGLARRFGDAEVQGRCLHRMACSFSGLRAEDLAKLPAQMMMAMLHDDDLEVG
jgi:hypothetical protein